MRKAINTEYILGRISKKALQETYDIDEDRIEHIPSIRFSNQIQGLEKVSDKEYYIHIKIGSNRQFLIPGSKIVIKHNDNNDINIEEIKICQTNESVVRVPVLKFNKIIGRSMYLITDYYTLISEDVVKIKLSDEIGSPEFYFTDILRIS